MSGIIDYKNIFDKHLLQIRSIRSPQSVQPEIVDLEWSTVVKQSIFDFGYYGFSKYAEMIDFARKESIGCLYEILDCLQKKKALFQFANCKDPEFQSPKVCFVLQDLATKELLIFKEIENGPFWKCKSNEEESNQARLIGTSMKSYKYVYLVYDYAYLQVINHNNDESDPGRGQDVFSLKWFFETYYGQEESKLFFSALDDYTQAVNECLGFFVAKSLTPGALFNFRKIVEREIVHFRYENLLSRTVNNCELDTAMFHRINNQFISSGAYLVAVGNSDFSESLITAEWLYDSLKSARAIDLTVIGVGYFKAIEQLMYRLICLHANKGYKIQKDYSRKDLPAFIELTDKYIGEKAINTTIGAMAKFYKDNIHQLLRNDLDKPTKKYIKESLFAYKNLRNEYFHKENINDWHIIESIRAASFSMLFLLLGGQSLSEANLVHLGLPEKAELSDYAQLCEYIDYHANALFYVDFEHKKGAWMIGCRDTYKKLIANKYIKYSGVYLKELNAHGQVLRFSEQNLPRSIYLGKFDFSQSEGVDLTHLVKVKKLFENGKFVGPSIIEESGFDY